MSEVRIAKPVPNLSGRGRRPKTGPTHILLAGLRTLCHRSIEPDGQYAVGPAAAKTATCPDCQAAMRRRSPKQ